MSAAAVKHALLSITVVLGAAFAAAPVAAQYHTGSTPLYQRYYYSDSTYTEMVGDDRDTCNRWGIGATATNGSWTSHVQTEIWAYCVNGQLSDTPE